VTRVAAAERIPRVACLRGPSRAGPRWLSASTSRLTIHLGRTIVAAASTGRTGPLPRRIHRIVSPRKPLCESTRLWYIHTYVSSHIICAYIHDIHTNFVTTSLCCHQHWATCKSPALSCPSSWNRPNLAPIPAALPHQRGIGPMPISRHSCDVNKTQLCVSMW
jgi:hypothetical protein